MRTTYTTNESMVQGLKLIKTDRNGSKHYHNTKCPRCGGSGRISMYSYVDNGICFECRGSGVGNEMLVLRTEEYQNKLNAKKKEKALKEAPAKNKKYIDKLGFNENGNIFIYLGNTFEIKEELKANGARFEYSIGWYSAEKIGGFAAVEMNAKDLFEYNAYGEIWSWKTEKINQAKEDYEKSFQPETNYVGNVGDKIEIEVKLVGTKWFDSAYGSTCFNTMKDLAGNIYVWKTNKEVPETAKIKGTIKEHKEYNGIKQTILTRCKVL